jgi:hypothetical protein
MGPEGRTQRRPAELVFTTSVAPPRAPTEKTQVSIEFPADPSP